MKHYSAYRLADGTFTGVTHGTSVEADLPLNQRPGEAFVEGVYDKLAKVYDLGAHTGSYACIKCGASFSFREKAELAAARRG